MSEALLTLNAGSSSLKFAVFTLGSGSRENDDWRDLRLFLSGQIAGINAAATPVFKARLASGASLPAPDLSRVGICDHASAIQWALTWLTQQLHGLRLIGVGHRVVHGGPHYTRPALLTTEVLAGLTRLVPLAPHHQPHNLAAIHAVASSAAYLPQVACFDTAFHATQPALARRLPIPEQFAQQGLERYGFHGLSYEYIASVLPEYHAGQMPTRTIVAHLGNGASVCALQNGQSIATSMGFSTLDGLLMGTRSGSIDPGVILHWLRSGMTEAELTQLLYNQCGLLGVSGLSADMQVLLASPDPRASLAVELFCYTLVRSIGSHLAALEGLDTLVFTGGIGEHAAYIRQAVCTRLHWLGITLDEAANAQNAPLISGSNSRIRVQVIPTNEERVIACHTLELLP